VLEVKLNVKNASNQIKETQRHTTKINTNYYSR